MARVGRHLSPMARIHHGLRSFFLFGAWALPLLFLAVQYALGGADSISPFRALVALGFDVPLGIFLLVELVRTVRPPERPEPTRDELLVTAVRALVGAGVMAVAATLTVHQGWVELVCGGGFGDTGVPIERLVIATFASLGIAAVLMVLGGVVGFAERRGAATQPHAAPSPDGSPSPA